MSGSPARFACCPRFCYIYIYCFNVVHATLPMDDTWSPASSPDAHRFCLSLCVCVFICDTLIIYIYLFLAWLDVSHVGTRLSFRQFNGCFLVWFSMSLFLRFQIYGMVMECGFHGGFRLKFWIIWLKWKGLLFQMYLNQIPFRINSCMWLRLNSKGQTYNATCFNMRFADLGWLKGCLKQLVSRDFIRSVMHFVLTWDSTRLQVTNPSNVRSVSCRVCTIRISQTAIAFVWPQSMPKRSHIPPFVASTLILKLQ